MNTPMNTDNTWADDEQVGDVKAAATGEAASWYLLPPLGLVSGYSWGNTDIPLRLVG